MTFAKADYEALLERRIARVTPVSGGDIGESVRLECEDGPSYFAKRYCDGNAQMAEAEAASLRWLAAAKSVRVPHVIAANAAPSPVLVLEWIDQGTRAPGFDEALGRGLARLHGAGAPGFGYERNNFIGTLPQRNTPQPRWSDFYARERIAPQLKMATRAGHIGNELGRALMQLIETMDQHCGPEVRPARLHGDLWSGNVIADERGQPCLVDPAAYAGHPEVDLSMMRLFGGFAERVFDAYREAAPLPDGTEERIGLWQLYPLLVHVNLFGGGSYVHSVAQVVRRFV